jgi:cell division septation protein DedD
MGRIIAGVLGVAIASTVGGCISTEEMGGKTPGPQLTVMPPDTFRAMEQSQPAAQAEPERPPETKKSLARQTFTTRRDTVVGSVVHKSKSPSNPPRKIERPANPAFTVQIGAFTKAPNALLFQKTAKERFADHPVFNNFNPDDKLYRVSVGKFDHRKEAAELRRELLNAFPKEYAECWVNYIPK